MSGQRRYGEQPRDAGPKPPLPEQLQAFPGIEARMTLRPDSGEASYPASGRLEGKVAVITGGDSGICQAVALAFAREGADVLIAYLNEHEDAEQTARVARQAGRTAVTMPGDIADEAHCRAIVERAVGGWSPGRPGQQRRLPVDASRRHHGYPIRCWERTYRTNIFAMFYLCRAALPHRRPGSAIINTASIEAHAPKPALLAYASTKGAIVTFTKGLRPGGHRAWCSG